MIKIDSVASYLLIDVSDKNWKDWEWHIRNRIRSIDQFEAITGILFSPEEKASLNKTISHFPMAITPYFASLIDTHNPIDDPIFKQCFPSVDELLTESFEMNDPLHEDLDSPIACITHRYPDRVLFLVCNYCAMYCRHCTRKRRVGDVDYAINTTEINQAIDYIRNHQEIRDVLLSGGDPFMLPTQILEKILSMLRSIEHVEIIRIGSRMPVVLPYRITDELVEMLKKYHPLWINTQFNHPRELTKASKK